MFYIEDVTSQRRSEIGFLFHQLYTEENHIALSRFGDPKEINKWITQNEWSGSIQYPWSITDTGGYCSRLIVIPYTSGKSIVEVMRRLNGLSTSMSFSSIEVHKENINKLAIWPTVLSWFKQYHPTATITLIK